MKFTPAIWFGAACALLGAILISEWLPAAETSPIVAAGKPAAAPKLKAAADGDGDAAPEKDTTTWADTVIARPLFNVGRRAPKTKAGTTQVAANGLPRLSGIMVGPAGRRAIFMPDTGKAVVLAEGAALDDGTIRRISLDSVTITGPKGDTVLRPSFDHNRVASAGVLPNGPMFPQGGLNNFAPNFPHAGFNPAFQQPGIAMPQPAPDAGDADDATPTPPPAPPPPGFRNPMIPRGRE